MPAVLPVALLVAVALAALATVLAFTVGTSATPRWGTALESVGAAAVVAAGALGIAAALDAGPLAATAVAVGLGATVLAWHPATRAWDPRGRAAWALSVDAGVLYLAYVLVWSLTSDAGWLTTIASLALWSLELFLFVLGLAYLWELVDVLARRTWSGTAAHTPGAGGPAARPFVSLHVPTHNEPPDMVIETVEKLLRLDYDDYEVLVVDNNTTDPALWQPVEAYCARQPRVRFLHLEDWPGFKSGALNHALTVTDPRAEVIGIVDADYHVDPSFLRECAPRFDDPAVSFVQTPQDYRDWEASPYFRRLYRSYNYFFDVSQRSRAERNGAIFGGTMGLIRRSALVEAGGWDEWCITEDAELSLRLLKAGGRGVHIDRSYGRGVMPLTFEALKGQRHRWCFGGVQILRLHWRSLLPGRRTEENQLTGAQRWAYLTGGIQWFGDLASVLLTGFLLVGALDSVVGEGLVIRRISGLLLLAVLALVLLGALRSLALVRRTSGASWGEALGAFGLWLALGPTVARAAWSGLVSKAGTFLRTPKLRGEPGVGDALRGNRVETLLAVVCAALAVPALLAGTAGAAAVGTLLLVQGAGYAAAPVNSLAAIRSDLPEELRRRRRDRIGSWATVVRRPARRGAVVTLGAAAAFAAFVALASPVAGPSLRDLPDRGGPDAAPVEGERVERRQPDEPGSTTPSRGAGGSPVSATDGAGGGAGGADAAPATAGPSPAGGPTAGGPTAGGPTAPGTTAPPPSGSADATPTPAGQGPSATASPPAAEPTPPRATPTRRPPSAASSPTKPPQANDPTPGGPSDKPGGGGGAP